jgi:chromosome segregation ATPase
VRDDEKAQKEENLQLQAQLHRLEEKLVQLTQDNDQLNEDLSGEKARYVALQEDFQQYQSKHSADGKLEELHASILAIQQQISDEES